MAAFPPVLEDLAVIVTDATPAERVEATIRNAAGDLLAEVRLFDLYRGQNIAEGRKSLAFRVVMQDTARTLTDAEVDAAMAELEQVLLTRFGAQRRG